jgi:hypothetical protein
MNAFDEISLEKAQRIADRRNQRRRDKLPLFADDVDQVTAAQVQEEFRRHQERFAECLRRLQATADAFRCQVAALVTAAEMGQLDERRLILPTGVEYAADFWREQLERLKGGDAQR